MNMDHEYMSKTNPTVRSSSYSGHRSGKTKGRYLKEQPRSSRRRSRRRRKLNPRFVFLVAVMLALLIGIIFAVRSCSRPSIVGRWDIDGTTVYEFGKDGKGALVLMTMEYEFTYTIEDDLVRINFVDEGALDADYIFQVQKDTLFLTGGPGDAKSEYVLDRIG